MSRPVIVRPEADADIFDIYAALQADQPGLGDRFSNRLRAVLQRLDDMPMMYGRVWRRVRAAKVTRFKYVVYYQVFRDSVDVLAVVHGSRDPSVWQSRV